MQKGQIFIFLLIGILILAVAGGAYYLGKSATPKSQTPNNVVFSQPSSVPTSLTKIFSDPSMDITFDYPQAFFEYKNSTSQNIVLSAQIKNNPIGSATPDDPAKTDDFITNDMTVTVTVFNNPKQLALRDLLASEFNRPGIDGKTTWYDSMKALLKESDKPIEGSLSFKDILGENPIKIIFFPYKSKVYEFSLIGGFGTGGQYSPQSESIFDQMLSTVKFQ